MKTLTVNLPDALESELEEISRREQCPADEVALRLLERGVRASRFRELRRESLDALGPEAAETDREAFDAIS